MDENTIQKLLTDLQRVRVDIDYRSLKSLSFETKATVYQQLLAGVNPHSKIHQLVYDCSKVSLPKVRRFDGEFTQDDYQEAFYNILGAELHDTSLSEQQLRTSKEANYSAMQYLVKKFAFKNVQECKNQLAKAEKKYEKEEEDKEKKRYLQEQEQLEALKKEAEKQAKKQLATQVPKITKQVSQPKLTKPASKTEANEPSISQMRQQILNDPDQLPLQLVYLEKLVIKYQTQIRNYQKNLQQLSAAAVHMESYARQQDSPQSSALVKSIQEFYKAQEVQIDEEQEDIISMHKQLKHQVRAKNQNFYIDLKNYQQVLQSGDQDQIAQMTEHMLSYYTSKQIQTDAWFDIFQ